MRPTRWLPTLALLPALATALPADDRPKKKDGCPKCCQKSSEKDDRATARQLVETRTGGRVVALRRTRINGATRPGFAAEVNMPGKDKGWLCLVDMDLPPKIYSTREIPNPPAPKGKGVAD
jgi:hypothetical protein